MTKSECRMRLSGSAPLLFSNKYDRKRPFPLKKWLTSRRLNNSSHTRRWNLERYPFTELPGTATTFSKARKSRSCGRTFFLTGLTKRHVSYMKTLEFPSARSTFGGKNGARTMNGGQHKRQLTACNTEFLQMMKRRRHEAKSRNRRRSWRQAA